MAVFLNKDRLVSPLEEMTDPSMQFIEELRIHAIQLPHAERQIAIRRFDQQMIMVVHQAVSVADPIVALVDMLESVEKVYAVLVGLEDRLFFISPGGDMVDSAGVLNA